MDQQDEDEFQMQWRERQEELKGIIAIMGPPYTRKTEVAQRIGRWAKCPALCIQDFFFPLAADYMKTENAVVAASDKEVVVQHAFTNLCKVAHRHLLYSEFDPTTVAIKSRLNSTFELQRLLDLVSGTKYPLLFIECRFTNEYLWQQHFDKASDWSKEEFCSWYRPGSWMEMEKARDDYYHPQSQSDWDLHLQQLVLKASTDLDYRLVVRRLVVDPIDILSRSFQDYLPIDFANAIKYLLTTPQEDLVIISQKMPYNIYTVGLHELRPYLIEKRLKAKLAAKGRRKKHMCSAGKCVFEFSEQLILHDNDVVCCGVCGKQVDSRTPAYTCRLCILTLHKSCAEKVHFKALRFLLGFLLRHASYYHKLMPEKHACKPCQDQGKGFTGYCGSCNFQTHLKCGLLPTIINHNSHPPHFLSLSVTRQNYRCRACGEQAWEYSYCCKPCGLYYHLKCAFLPLELLKHEHGGHEHVMKLLYSHHDTDEDLEPEESYWCEVCYEDMDPQAWCYSCKECLYYSAHVKCSRGYEYLRSSVKKAKFVQQIQSQLEDAMADSELHEEKFDSEPHEEFDSEPPEEEFVSELHEERFDPELHEEEYDSESSDSTELHEEEYDSDASDSE